MNRSACCLCRCRQLLLIWPRSQLRPFHLRRTHFDLSRFFSMRRLHTYAPASSATPSLRPALDDHIEPELTSTASPPTSVVDVAARIQWLLSAKYELDAVVLFQRNRHSLPLSVWNAVLATAHPQASPLLLPPPAAYTAVVADIHQSQQQPALLTSLDLFLADLQTRSLQPDATTYQLCMDVAASAGEWQRVLHWWHEMKASGVRPTLTVAHHVMMALTETCQPALIKPLYLVYFTSAHSTTTTTITARQSPAIDRSDPTSTHLPLPAVRSHPAARRRRAQAVESNESPPPTLRARHHVAHFLPGAYLGGEGKSRGDDARVHRAEAKSCTADDAAAVDYAHTAVFRDHCICRRHYRVVVVGLLPSSRPPPVGWASCCYRSITVLEDLTLHSAHSSSVHHNHNGASEDVMVDALASARPTVTAPLLNPSLYALIIATFSALRDTHRTLRYYQQYCEYCVSVLSSTASSSAAPSLASPSFSSSTHSAILHSMLRLYALQGEVSMMEGYLGELVSGRLGRP